MSFYRNLLVRLSLVVVTASLIAGCTTAPPPERNGESVPTGSNTAPVDQTGDSESEPGDAEPVDPANGSGGRETGSEGTTGKPADPSQGRSVTLVPDPASITALVNKEYALPRDYVPADLVEPNVAFIFEEKSEKRLMRAEAARALEEMFNAAKEDGIYLAGVSGYRSYETQEWLFNYYVDIQGEETARRYSAEPGHSEHQTGLVMDVSGSTGYCAADDCFAGTPEAEWLAENSWKYGFIIRYPEGKESITGYAYEPWHVRYIGKELAADVFASGLTLEEYFAQAQTASTPAKP